MRVQQDVTYWLFTPSAPVLLCLCVSGSLVYLLQMCIYFVYIHCGHAYMLHLQIISRSFKKMWKTIGLSNQNFLLLVSSQNMLPSRTGIFIPIKSQERQFFSLHIHFFLWNVGILLTLQVVRGLEKNVCKGAVSLLGNVQVFNKQQSIIIIYYTHVGLYCLKNLCNEVLLYCTGNYIQPLGIDHDEK